MPLCFGASGSVRHSAMPIWLCCATDVQTFCPSRIHPPSLGTARVCRPARSDPASGSLNSWQAITSPRYMAGR